MKKKIAFLFAGQGAQYIGMGEDFYREFSYVKNLYDLASQQLGYDITKICFENNALINQTKYAQPAILITSLAILKVIKNEFQINPDVVAGFSLGEYSALFEAKVFDIKTIINLVKHRAYYMEEASIKNPGAMAAIIGLNRFTLESLCMDTKDVYIANYNCPDQIVVAGLTESVKLLCEKAKIKGARRTIMLNVSGAFHTPIMHDAADKMYNLIMQTDYLKPKCDIYMNYQAQKLDIKQLPIIVKKQIESPVYFEDIIKKFILLGVDLFIEIGPGTVLSGFVRKIDPTKTVISINKVSDLKLIGGQNGIKR